MESFGRTIALGVGIIGIFFLLLFSKTVSVQWQRHETVRSMSHAFAKTVLRDKSVMVHKWNSFQKELRYLGAYRAELTVYERRRFEDENGGFYIFEKSEITGNKELKEGSFVRILVTQKDSGNGKIFLSVDCGAIVTGGRVQ